MLISGYKSFKTYKPLERIEIKSDIHGILSVVDGCGQEYYRSEDGGGASFAVGGALGLHEIRFLNEMGGVLEKTCFKVDCETEIQEETGQFGELLTMLHYTMESFLENQCCLFQGRVYKYFVSWLRDHVHTLKGMKYFSQELKSAMELYRDSQREDGMIWDNVKAREPARNEYQERFEYADFVKVAEDGYLEFKRIPVENDLEFLFVEGIYYTWKATGDDGWMAGMLDGALKAFDYSQKNSYRWSEKFKLLKRSFTIDTWDFQCDEDAQIAGDDIMAIYDDRTRFGIMHGDNTGFAIGCRYLSEMLTHVGRNDEASRYAKLGMEIKERLDRLAWNGNFYTHYIPEDESIQRDLGADHEKQLSLSNAYALNRNIPHKQCVSIIKEYLKIKEALPHGSPGEWYTIYPPFQRGFGEACNPWEYMNGGVTSIVAGELAHGAFEHGFEEYGADILKRIHGLAARYQGFLDCCFKGARPEKTPPEFIPLDLSGTVNAREGIPGWKGDAGSGFNELLGGARIIGGIPFSVPVPTAGSGKTCIGLHCGRTNPAKAVAGVTQRINGKLKFIAFENLEEGVPQCVIPVGRKAETLYFLHVMTGNGLAGDVNIEYADGSTYSKYINEGSDILNWWLPKEPACRQNRKDDLAIAWEGKNHLCGRVGLSLYGMLNPHPEKEIVRIGLHAAKNGNYWCLYGITLAEEYMPVKPNELSFGIPDNWGAAAVAYALVEGLAGITDTGTAFDKVRLSPRWNAAGVRNSSVSIKYPASGGYAAYNYCLDPGKKQLMIDATGSGSLFHFHCLLPEGISSVSSVEADGRKVGFRMVKVEQSSYIDLHLDKKGAFRIVITYI